MTNDCASCGHDITHHTRRVFGMNLWMSGCDIKSFKSSNGFEELWYVCPCKKFEERKGDDMYDVHNVYGYDELYDTDGKRLR